MLLAAVDFETEAIVNGSPTSPVPVGLAYQVDGHDAEYLSWGHDTNNNCTFEDGKTQYQILMTETQPIFHNCKFDLRVGREHFGITPAVYHDTMLMAFLDNPHARQIGLKPLSDALLDMPPDEAEEIKEWILANVKEARKSNWGAYIARVPGDLAGKYAKGDVIRTLKLWKHYMPVLMADHEMVNT